MMWRAKSARPCAQELQKSKNGTMQVKAEGSYEFSVDVLRKSQGSRYSALKAAREAEEAGSAPLPASFNGAQLVHQIMAMKGMFTVGGPQAYLMTRIENIDVGKQSKHRYSYVAARGRGLHSSTFRLNVEHFLWDKLGGTSLSVTSWLRSSREVSVNDTSHSS